MKKFSGIAMAGLSILALASCRKDNEKTVKKVQLAAPTISLSGKTLSWDAVENATSYEIQIGEKIVETTETKYVLRENPGNYDIRVQAKSTNEKYTKSSYSNDLTYSKVLTQKDIFLVGDSTVCNYYDSAKDTMVDDKYYYPRYGYGMKLNEYFDKKANIVNLAISGRSAKSFLTEDNYDTLKADIGTGDYLFIGFGHNDEKVDDAARGSYANRETTDSTSFKYYLYNYYIKLALDAGATPILCTPIVRLDSNNEYTGDKVHNTVAGGDYRQAIIDLGAEKNVDVIDLTSITKDIYQNLGYDEAKYFHAMGTVFTDLTQTEIKARDYAPDGTHLNVYGASRVAYEISEYAFKNINVLSDYVKAVTEMPTKDKNLVKWKNARRTPYSTPDLENYQPKVMYETITEGWYGSAMGNGVDKPNGFNEETNTPDNNGFWATETSQGVFKVGQYKEGLSAKGKFESGGDGFAFVFRQFDINHNFKLEADVSILNTLNVKQAAFGLMVRDESYINLDSGEALDANFAAAGLMQKADGVSGEAQVNFKREGGSLSKGKTLTSSPQVGDAYHLTLQRDGQNIICTISKNGTVIDSTTYLDLKFDDIDSDYMYIGMFATHGLIAEFTNVSFVDNGEAGQA